MKALSNFEVFPRTDRKNILARAESADILIVNKLILDRPILEQLPRLKYICVSATGYNNVDLDYCREKKIPVSNVSGYSTPAVAQHVFAMLFALTSQVERYNQEVHQGVWSKQNDFAYWHQSIDEIYGKVMGLYGFGKIGKAVANVGLAFGMKVIVHRKNPEKEQIEGIKYVSLDELFSQSDVLSLHAPLNEENKGIISLLNLAKMKPTSYLINTARGGLVNELALRNALENKRIAGAALDVLSAEPPPPDHILLGLDNCIITPHQAWASLAARRRLLNEVVKNVEGFLNGKMRNVIS
jgi:glycerate dehydrogenase